MEEKREKSSKQVRSPVEGEAVILTPQTPPSLLRTAGDPRLEAGSADEQAVAMPPRAAKPEVLRSKDIGDASPFLTAFGVYGAVGFQLALTVVGGLLVGSFLDKRWGSSPWLTLVGLLAGATGGFYNLIRILQWKEKRRG